MDIEKLIEAVRLCGSTPMVDQCKKCTYWAGGDMSKCIPRMTTDAATALSTFQAENETLRAELKSKVDLVFQQAKELDRRHLLLQEQEAELEQVKRELDICIKAVFGDCDYCKYDRSLPDDTSPCWHCKEYAAQEFVTGNYWQWRGPEEESK